jgi:hypothetical protein
VVVWPVTDAPPEERFVVGRWFVVGGPTQEVGISLAPTYRLHDTTGDDLGLIEHPAPKVEPR